jgi:dienelactone hydrolase
VTSRRKFLAQSAAAIAATAAGKTVPTSVDWNERRKQILTRIQLVMGRLPTPSRREPLDMQWIGDPIQRARHVLRRLSFATERTNRGIDRVEAYLLEPSRHDPAGRLPAVLCLHATNRGKEEPAALPPSSLPDTIDPDGHYAVHLAERGYTALAVDHPNLSGGNYTFDTYGLGYASNAMKAVWNNIRAVDLLAGLPDVDPYRIGCLGHSLGGNNTLFTMVFEPRIKVGVSNCGFSSFSKTYPSIARPHHFASPAYMPRIESVFESNSVLIPFDFRDVIAACAPRPILISHAEHDPKLLIEGVRAAVASALPAYDRLGVRTSLGASYFPGGHSFPPEAQAVAYDWLDYWLKGNPTTPS